ncbi:hypothetical protein Q73A0000_05965 [Kaistella flava (ex Peng et al. 2021)]|uniref:Uncharacterized protein n=1 Tax=Kaistella flava (ex Peng et al. 2021) TaxID=2038776 RepID=A0A7M2Y6R3_9FLAO|nr:hypothetical protein [Kaistella flava (ex Peng et al. 2021)]QOW09938.1 hypothetical protein Q73A0000_05965 [Kaistella flava (ex Peng et al. 2021)]
MKKLLLFLWALLFSFGYSQKTVKQKEILKIYNSKKFYNDDIFLKDLEGAIKYGVLDHNEAEIECLGYYIGRMKTLGKLQELRKYKHEEIYWMSEAECQIRDEMQAENDSSEKIDRSAPEKRPVLQKSNKEANQYIQIQFSKTKQGCTFFYTKIIEGDLVNINASEHLQDIIKQDFEKDKPGNYTAFYDVFYVDDNPKKITLKTRLNR